MNLSHQLTAGCRQHHRELACQGNRSSPVPTPEATQDVPNLVVCSVRKAGPTIRNTYVTMSTSVQKTWAPSGTDPGPGGVVTQWNQRTTATWTGKPRRSRARVGRRREGEKVVGSPGPSQRRTRHRGRKSFGVAHLCERLGVGRPCVRVWIWSSQEGHQSSDPNEGGASLEAAKRTRRIMARSHGEVTKRCAEPVRD